MPFRLALLLLLAAPREEAARITLRQGVVGGFAPAVERLRVEITRERNQVTVRLKELVGSDEGDPKRSKVETRTGTMKGKELEALLREIEPLWKLPVEDPRNGEDIYGLDTIVKVESKGEVWANGAPAGCIHVPSRVQPTGEEKETFRRITGRIVEVARKHAIRAE